MKTRELIKIQSWLVVQRRPFSSAHNVKSIFSRQNGMFYIIPTVIPLKKCMLHREPETEAERERDPEKEREREIQPERALERAPERARERATYSQREPQKFSPTLSNSL